MHDFITLYSPLARICDRDCVHQLKGLELKLIFNNLNTLIFIVFVF